MRRMRSGWLVLGLALVLTGLHSTSSALAQSSTPAMSVEAVALYRGQDREQKLLEGARKEGGLNLYTSMIGPDQDAFFEFAEQELFARA